MHCKVMTHGGEDGWLEDSFWKSRTKARRYIGRMWPKNRDRKKLRVRLANISPAQYLKIQKEIGEEIAQEQYYLEQERGLD